jgi:alpha-N-arabinofuranosidase
MRLIRFAVLALALFAAMPARAEQRGANGGEPIQVTIDATRPGAPINPFIYGQFIEHLGRCIYGGIWAEMLEDRKFYFPITDDYHPYRSLEKTKFPVVGASPWQVTGPKGSVTMVKEKPFVGEQSPRIAAGSGIRQNDLGVVAGKNYVGYLWLLAPEGAARVTIKFGAGEKNARLGVGPLTTPNGEYVRIPIEFAAAETTDKAWLAIEVADKPCVVGTVSLMPADNVRGMRADTLALLKQLNATIYRWPGGNFVSGYDWRDGIGPRDRRPPRRNPAWTGVEHNDFGIDEFIDFCHEVGAEPMIAANTGFGDDYSAAQEVEYTNGSAETIGGGWRVKNQHAAPYGVKYWCVGNEMWGPWQLGYMQLGQYVLKHNRVARAMHKVDPNLVLIASGDLGTKATLGDGRERREVSWSEGMLERCGDEMDLISEHFYSNKRIDDIPAHVAQVVDSIRGKAEGHRRMERELEPLKKNRRIPIAMDEWNYWFNEYEYGELGCVYQLRDALGIAAGLHEYFRNSDIIQMAQYAQTVNVIGCVKTTKTGAFLDATALPLLLYRREFGTAPLKVSGEFAKSHLDIAAATTADGAAMTIGVVNPTADSRTVQILTKGAKLSKTSTQWRIGGGDPTLANSLDKQPLRVDESKNAPFDGKLTVPPYSVSLYRVGKE